MLTGTEVASVSGPSGVQVSEEGVGAGVCAVGLAPAVAAPYIAGSPWRAFTLVLTAVLGPALMVRVTSSCTGM